MAMQATGIRQQAMNNHVLPNGMIQSGIFFLKREHIKESSHRY
jgi:hypothetical protein